MSNLRGREVPAIVGAAIAAASGIAAAMLYLQDSKYEALLALLACALFSGATAYMAVSDAFEVMKRVIAALSTTKCIPEAPPPRPALDPTASCVVGALLPPSVGVVLVDSLDSVYDLVDWFREAIRIQGVEVVRPPARGPPPLPAVVLSTIVIGLPALIKWYYKKLDDLSSWITDIERA